jgi:hypothetical protein
MGCTSPCWSTPAIRGAAILTAAADAAGADAVGDLAELDPADANLVRVVEYDVPDRAGNGTGELIVVLSTILDPGNARPDELAAAYHQRWALAATRAGPPGDLGLTAGPSRAHRLDHLRRRGRGPRHNRVPFTRGPAHRPPYR